MSEREHPNDPRPSERPEPLEREGGKSIDVGTRPSEDPPREAPKDPPKE